MKKSRWVLKVLLNVHQVVGVEEYFFCIIRVVMLKVVAMKPLDYTKVILKVNNYNRYCAVA